MAEVEPRKFDLLGMMDSQLLQNPVVQRAMNLELQSADGMGDAFDRI
jgi:hypothetical protein